MKTSDYYCDRCGEEQKKRIPRDIITKQYICNKCEREEAKKILQTEYDDIEQHEEEIIRAIGIVLEAQE